MASLGRVTIGQYDILHTLGVGSFGKVKCKYKKLIICVFYCSNLCYYKMMDHYSDQMCGHFADDSESANKGGTFVPYFWNRPCYAEPYFLEYT
jgi:hypothetical protein